MRKISNFNHKYSFVDLVGGIGAGGIAAKTVKVEGSLIKNEVKMVDNVDFNNPRSIKGKTSAEIGQDLTNPNGKYNLSKNEAAESTYATKGNFDVDIYRNNNNPQTEVIVNKGDGFYTDGEKNDKPVYVKVNEPNKPNQKYIDTERYNTGINNKNADKSYEVIDINTGETISKAKQTYKESTTHDFDDKTGKLTPKGE